MRYVIPNSDIAWYSTICLLLGLCLGSNKAVAQEPLPRRISLGVQVKPVSVDTQQRLKLRNSRGVEVVSVVPDSTAAGAGIMPGDVILALGRPTHSRCPQALWNKSLA